MDTAPTNSESLTHAPAATGQAKPRRRRGPVLRAVNLTKRKQDAEHRRAVEIATERRQAEIDAASGASRRLLEKAELVDWAGNPIEAPRRNMGSEQGVMVLKRITLASTIHPDDHAAYSDADLATVVDDESEEIALDADFYRHVDRIPDSIHRHMLAYQTESQEKAQATFESRKTKQAEKQRRRADRARKARKIALCYKWAGRPLPAAASKRVGAKVETAAVVVDERDAAKARAQAEKYPAIYRDGVAESRDRMQHGFLLAKRTKVAGDHYEPFHEFLGEGVLRSHLSPVLARFAQIVPRRGRIRAGYNKEALFETPTKLIALDCPYVELDQTRHCCIVVEFDTVWASAASFRLALLKLLPPHMLPNLIVGRKTRDGQFARPHCIWYLNPCVVLPDGKTRNACVWNDPLREIVNANTGEATIQGHEDCKTGPIKFFHAVQRGLVAHLLPLGADPGCWNIYKPKNPLSPFWSTLVCNEDFMPELKDFVGIKDFSLTVDEADLARRAATMRADAAKAEADDTEDDEDKVEEIRTPSNLLWATVGQVIEPMVSKYLKIRDVGFLTAAHQGAEPLARWFDDRVRPQVEEELLASPSLDRILEGRCKFAANYCIRALERSASRHAHAFKVGKGKAKNSETADAETKPKRKRLRPVNRGRDESLKVGKVVGEDGVERDRTKKELQKLNGERSGATRTAVVLWRMCQMLHVNGVTIDDMRSASRSRKAEIIQGLVGMVSESFAYDKWNAAIEARVADAAAAASGNSAKVTKDKKQELNPDHSINPSCLSPAPSASFAPADPAKPIEPTPLDHGSGPPEVGILDHRQSTRTSGWGAMFGDAVDRAPEPVES